MNTVCPKCGYEFKLKRGRDPEREPVVLCSKCKAAFFPEAPHLEEVRTVEEEQTAVIPPSDHFLARQRQARRYLVLVLMLLAVFVLYQWYQSIEDASPWLEARNNAVKSILREVAVAQEACYSDTGTYTADLDVLSPYYLKRRGVIVQIISADSSKWSAIGYHIDSPLYFLYDTGSGGLRSEALDRKTMAEIHKSPSQE